MPLELKKATPTRLKSLDLDEKWLQDRIEEDTSLHGLGDLHVIKRERTQPSGGRIDFLMSDPESETRFEVEIMLGALDESHIIRAIEYWDIERQRFPTLDHRAVIVAEEITSRFFNVIRLLNRAVPMIALQLNAFRFDDAVVLHFTKVLDVYEPGDEDEEEAAEQTDRRYWDKRASTASLAIFDRLVSMVPSTDGQPRTTYNKGHIALGTSGYNFCWFRPSRSARCHIQMRLGQQQREEIVHRLDDAGLDVGLHRRHSIRFGLTEKALQENVELLRGVIEMSERWSRTRGD